MQILVNGESREVNASSLEAVLAELEFKGATVATALNGEFVAAGARSSTPLREGDRVEILAPMRGG